MAVKVSTIGLKGLEGYRISVEIETFSGSPSMVIVGLPDASVRESKERVMSVLRHLDSSVFSRKIVVNLSPSEQKKNGPLFDLAIAIGIMKELYYIKSEIPEDVAFLGTLSLDGAVLNAEGMLPAVVAAKSLGMKTLYMPFDPSIPFHMIKGIDIVLVEHIQDVVKHLAGEKAKQIHPYTLEQPSIHEWFLDFSHVIGQEQAKRGVEIAAAGEHNVFMIGPPGCGKSLIAECIPSILPPLSISAQLEVMSLYQLARKRHDTQPFPPFRNPHHSSSSIALVGGGSYPMPGEISLAHNGVLFLDEIAEFSKKTLEMLRQPLENGKITISRVQSKVTYPTSFMLVAATNPCPCGYYGSSNRYCICSPKQIRHYLQRISGPILDRMDILLSMNSVPLHLKQSTKETSSEIRERVKRARTIQYERYQDEISNAKVSYKRLLELSPLSYSQQGMLTRMASKHDWSNRVQSKMIRVARTISDLAGEKDITDESIWEAMTLRRDTAFQQTVAR